MALTNNIIAGPDADISYGAYTDASAGRIYEFKFTVTQADIAALGAFLTGDVVLMNLPVKAIPMYASIKHSTAVAGPSISACSAQIQVQGGNLSSALDVFAAPSATGFDVVIATSAIAKPTSIAAVNPVKLHFIAVGANLSVATAGQIDCVIGYTVLP